MLVEREWGEGGDAGPGEGEGQGWASVGVRVAIEDARQCEGQDWLQVRVGLEGQCQVRV